MITHTLIALLMAVVSKTEKGNEKGLILSKVDPHYIIAVTFVCCESLTERQALLMK